MKTIDDMQRRYETTTMKSQDEKKMLADIRKMKDSIPNATRLLEIKPQIDALTKERNVLNDKINSLKPAIEAND